MRKPGWFLLFILLFAHLAHGQVEVRLLSQSASGQTIMLNIGHLEGIRPGEFAAILKPIRSPQEIDLRMVPVGKAKSIKVNSESSIWVVYRVFDGELLVVGDKFELLTESKMLSGRKKYSISRTEIVGNKKDIKQDTYEALEGDRERLTKLGNKYKASRQIHGPEDRYNDDFNVIDASVWEKEKGVAYKTPLYRGPQREEFRQVVRIETFEKLVSQYLKRVNDPEFSYDTFYAEQKKDERNPEFRSKSTFVTEYDNFLEAKSKEKTKEAEVYRAMLARGDSWSDDFSDEELKTMLGRVAKVEESLRRYKIQEKVFTHQLTFSAGLGMYDNETKDDPSNSKGQAKEFELGYEFFPFAKVDGWQNWSFFTSGRLNTTSFGHETYNVESSEYSAALGVNLYPWLPPQVIDKVVPFVGVYGRLGRSNLTALGSGQEGKYTLVAMPGIQAGVKYQLSNGVSLRVKGHIEKQQLEVIETKYLGANLPDRAELIDAKLGVGIGYAF